MATGQLAAVVKRLERMSDPGATDGELLERFLNERDETAFENLVRRHGDMVLGVCLRVLTNRQDAEDAFQGTFLVLARRAATVFPREQVGAWLHGVAYRTALGARRALLRRGARQKPLSEIPPPHAKPAREADDMLQVLDRELSQLPEKWRLPVVLCDLEGKSLRVAARQLGIPDATLSNRLRVGRDKLASRLHRLGVTAPPSVAPLFAGGLVRVLPDRIGEVVELACTPAVTIRGGWIPRLQLFSCLGGWKTMWCSQLAVSVLVLGLGITLVSVGANHGNDSRLRTGGATPKGKAVDNPDPRIQNAIDEAVKEVPAPGDEDGRSLSHRLVCDMAVFEAKRGRREAARTLFQRADALIDALPEEGRPGERRMLIQALARAGETREVIAAARRIPEANQFRDISLQEAARELARLGREKDALEVVGLVSDAKRSPWVRAGILEQIALAHARAGKMGDALAVVERIESPASRIIPLAGVVYFNHSFREYPEEPGIALLQHKAGDLNGASKTLALAAKLLDKVADREERDRPRCALACAWAQMGNIEETRKWASEITQHTGREVAQAALARAMVRAGKTKEALAEAGKLTDLGARAHVLTHIGSARAQARDDVGARQTFEAVHELLSGMEESPRQIHAHNLVSARAIAGDDRGAEKTADALLPRGSLGHINRAFTRVQAGDFKGALQLADSLKDSAWWRGNLVRAIAREQTKAGQEKAVRAWSALLESGSSRANALFGLAEGLAGVE